MNIFDRAYNHYLQFGKIPTDFSIPLRKFFEIDATFSPLESHYCNYSKPYALF